MHSYVAMHSAPHLMGTHCVSTDFDSIILRQSLDVLGSSLSPHLLKQVPISCPNPWKLTSPMLGYARSGLTPTEAMMMHIVV